MWVFDYFEKELNATIISDELIIDLNGKSFYLHHGDGLGKGDHAYKLLKYFFRSKFCQWLFARLHPNLGVGISDYWSKKSRIAGNKKQGELQKDYEEHWLSTFYQELKAKFGEVDYIVMGHRHFPIELNIDNIKYINLGEWVNYTSYAVFDGQKMKLQSFEPN